MAVNNAGVGERLDYRASTVSLPPVPPDTTTERQLSTDMTTLNQSQSKGDNSMLLSPAVFGGVITGAVLIVLIIILVTCLCIRRLRHDHGRYVNSKSPEAFGNLVNEQSIQTQKASGSEGSLRRIDFSSDAVQYGTNNKSKELANQSLPGRDAINGIENPGYDRGQIDTESIAVSMTLSSEDLFSQADSTLKRTSRMRSESAAAIAVMRNSRLPRLPSLMDDTDKLLNHDSVVIYTERTAL